MTLFRFLFRFHLTGSRLSPSELKVIDPIGAGLAGRALLEAGNETAAHLLAGFCMECVTGKSGSVSSVDPFGGELRSSTVFVCFFDRRFDGRDGFIRNLVSVCCLAMVKSKFKVRNFMRHPLVEVWYPRLNGYGLIFAYGLGLSFAVGLATEFSVICRFVDQLSVLLFSLADFIFGSRIVYYISNLIVERNKEQSFIFVTPKYKINLDL